MIKVIKWFLLGVWTIITIIPHYFIIGLLSIINPQKFSKYKYKGKPIITVILLIISLSCYLMCVYISSRWYVQNLKLKHLSNDILNSTEILENEKKEIISTDNYTPDSNDKYPSISFLSVDFKELLEKNNETVAWIKVNNTNVNQSVVQHNDNEYYLSHDFNKKKSYAGWVYGDFRDDFNYYGKNTIIYAHNMNNRTMFGSLIWCLKESWYKNEENQFIKLSSPRVNTIWKIFSIYTIEPEVYYLKTYFNDDSEYQSFLNTLKERSIHNFNEELDIDNKILTLSTCSDDGKKRVVIHAKLIKAEYR